MLLDGGLGAIPKVLRAYMGEAVLPPPHLRQNGTTSIGVGPTWGHSSQYALDCYGVALAM